MLGSPVHTPVPKRQSLDLLPSGPSLLVLIKCIKLHRPLDVSQRAAPGLKHRLYWGHQEGVAWKLELMLENAQEWRAPQPLCCH